MYLTLTVIFLLLVTIAYYLEQKLFNAEIDGDYKDKDGIVRVPMHSGIGRAKRTTGLFFGSRKLKHPSSKRLLLAWRSTSSLALFLGLFILFR